MMLPPAMLVIAIFVQPLPSLVAGTLSPGGFLIRCLLQLIALGGAVCLFTELPHRLQSGSLATRNIPLDRVLPLVPLFGSMYVRRNVRDCFESLALLLEAGMPILEACRYPWMRSGARRSSSDFRKSNLESKEAPRSRRR